MSAASGRTGASLPEEGPGASQSGASLGSVADFPASVSIDQLHGLPTGPLAPSSALARPLPSLPNLKCLREIGIGGMGVVYEAEDLLGRRWAVKLGREDQRSPQALARFFAEAKEMAGLAHPNVAPVHSYHEHEGRPYFLMPLFPDSLQARLARGPLTVREAVRVLADVADGLAYLHARGYVHRDVKPGNVLIDADGRAVVSDFGLLKPMVRAEAADGHDPGLELQRGATAVGHVPGTAAYMRPEVLAGQEPVASPRWDTYAAGVTFYQMLTGERPPVCRAPLSYAGADRDKAVPPPSGRNPRVPAALDRIVEKCCRREKGYAGAAELAGDLRRWSKRWARRSVAAGALALVALAVVLGLALVGGKAGPPNPGPPAAEVSPLDEMAEKLTRGETVTLIGETGMPKWHRVVVGQSHIKPTDRTPTRAFSINTKGTGLVVLWPRLGKGRLTITGEFRTSDGAEAGLALGVATLLQAPERTVTGFLGLLYQDQNKGLGHFDLTAACLVEDANGKTGRFDDSSPQRKDLPTVKGAPWRRLSAVTGPTGAEFRFRNEPVGGLPCSLPAVVWRPLARGPRFKGARWNTPLLVEGGIGVYTRDTVCYVRNLTVQRLPEE